jgi:serine/threonine protein kinase
MTYFMTQCIGGVYGLAADCWSLGAVLHVMLVARFPEFERDKKGLITLILPNKYWSDISVQAKDLVKSLMEPNAFTRMTVKEVLVHPWLNIYRSTHRLGGSTTTNGTALPPSLSPSVERGDDVFDTSVYDSTSIMSLKEEFDDDTIPMNTTASLNNTSNNSSTHGSNGSGILNTSVNTVVLKSRSQPTSGLTTPAEILPPDNTQSSSLSLGPLLNLQRSIALCFEDALNSYTEYPDVATQIHKGEVHFKL